MKAYEISKDTRFQSYNADLSEEDQRLISRQTLANRKAGLPLLPQWQPVPVYLYDPDNPSSDFFGAPIVGRFSLTERVYGDSVIRGLLETAGELLPMKVTETGNLIYVFNILSKSLLTGLVEEARCRTSGDYITNYAFHADKLPKGGIFSIPGCNQAFTAHGDELPPEKDFIQWYRRQGYTGLEFVDQIGDAAPKSQNPYRKGKNKR